MRRTSERAGRTTNGSGRAPTARAGRLRQEVRERTAEGNLLARVFRARPLADMSTRTFLLLVGVALGLSLALMLALNTLMAQGSFQRYELMLKKSELVITEQSLEATLASLDAPAALATRAEEMGMVMNPNPAFIDLSSGTLLGEPAIAEMPDPARDVGVSGDPTPTSDIGGETAVGLQPIEPNSLQAAESTR